jgi:peptidoglycan glycosyltransferase
MNPQVRKLYGVFALLFAAIVAVTSYWLWRAPSLEARQGNPTLVVRQVTIKRGLVLAADGTTRFAANRRRRVQGRTWYLRRYPTGKLVAQTVGYSTIQRSRSGLERSLNDFLTGSNADLHTVVQGALDRLKGETRRGNDVVTTIVPAVQRAALEQLAGKCGAVVALEPRTGKVLAIASSPSYDPNLIERHFAAATRVPGAACRPAAPLLNRATQGLYIPGSTFKVLTAAAALDSGAFTPESTFDDPGYCTEYGKKVTNFADQSGPEVFGRVDFATALEHSINSVFCNVGKRLGPEVILDYARAFGFYDKPPLETPSDERVASGLYRNGKLYLPKDPNAVDVGRLAFGQERMLVTPMQMAMVVSAIANGGVEMRPHLVERIVAPDGTVVDRTGEKVYRTPISPRTAAELTAMMTRVVESGTGTAAQIPGVRVAGKTGTAETGRASANDTWFVAFAPADDPRVAVAVALSNQTGTGGATAAPIARAVMQAVLGRNP